MSLDVSLTITRIENPGPIAPPAPGRIRPWPRQIRETVFDWMGLTHNLGSMARAANLYLAIWRPEELNPPATRASDLVPLLETGLKRLVAEKQVMLQYTPANGWGSYKGLLEFTRQYLAACRKYPDAEIQVCR